MSRVDPRDLWWLMESGSAPVVVDVRSAMEFARGHVPSAVHVPFWRVPWRLAASLALPDDPVVLYCGHGPRAWVAARLLRRRGFRNLGLLRGHMVAWRRAGLPEDVVGTALDRRHRPGSSGPP